MESKEQIKDNYKKAVFLESIKSGKVPKRSGLGTRIFHLIGLSDRSPYCRVENCDAPIGKPNLTRRLCYSNSFSYMERITKLLVCDKAQQTYLYYFSEYHLEHNWRYTYVFYDPKNEPCWSILDNDLKMLYPKNHRINNYGFVYFRK